MNESKPVKRTELGDVLISTIQLSDHYCDMVGLRKGCYETILLRNGLQEQQHRTFYLTEALLTHQHYYLLATNGYKFSR